MKYIVGETFPIKGTWGCDKGETIPWWLAEAFYEKCAELYAIGSTLEEVAEDGGFTKADLIAFLKGDEE